MTARQLRKALVVLAGAGIASGCVLAVDFDALEGSGASDDGAVDAPTLDVIDASSDAASDAGDDAMLEGGSSPCSTKHAFCADFDGDPYNAGFSKTNTTGTGSLGPDSLALSAPDSLHATTSVRKTANTNWLFGLEKDFNLPWRRVVFQGDVYFVQPDWQKGDINIALAGVYMFSSTGNTGSVFFRSQTSTTGSIENPTGGNTMYPTIPSFPYSTWTHIVIDFNPSGHLHYRLGTQTFDQDFTPMTPGNGQSIQIVVGAISYNQPIPAVDIRWDNVFVDFP